MNSSESLFCRHNFIALTTTTTDVDNFASPLPCTLTCAPFSFSGSTILTTVSEHSDQFVLSAAVGRVIWARNHVYDAIGPFPSPQTDRARRGRALVTLWCVCGVVVKQKNCACAHASVCTKTKRNIRTRDPKTFTHSSKQRNQPVSRSKKMLYESYRQPDQQSKITAHKHAHYHASNKKILLCATGACTCTAAALSCTAANNETNLVHAAKKCCT